MITYNFSLELLFKITLKGANDIIKKPQFTSGLLNVRKLAPRKIKSSNMVVPTQVLPLKVNIRYAI